jgi:hypothetical protein
MFSPIQFSSSSLDWHGKIQWLMWIADIHCASFIRKTQEDH